MVKKNKKDNFSTFFLIIAFFVLTFYLYNINKKERDMTPDEIKESVGKLMVLPENEVPTYATVNDLEPLKGNLFFEKARLGDKVLVYSKNGKAILYRPSENKIIEVGPLNIK